MKATNKNKFVKGNVKDFSKSNGYFIGRFLGEFGHLDLATEEVEVAWKKSLTTFPKKTPHYHKGGVEVSIIVSGGCKAWVGGKTVSLTKGDFLVVYPETPLRNISAEEGTEIIVVKAPSLPNDKFEVK